MIYVASYALGEELSAEQDDPSVKTDGLTDFARPRFSAVFSDFGGFELSLLFDAVKEEVVYLQCDEDELPLGDRDMVLDGSGEFKRIHPSSPREEAVWLVSRGDEIVATIVVQRLPLGM
jgi:hypothetical protein